VRSAGCFRRPHARPVPGDASTAHGDAGARRARIQAMASTESRPMWTGAPSGWPAERRLPPTRAVQLRVVLTVCPRPCPDVKGRGRIASMPPVRSTCVGVAGVRGTQERVGQRREDVAAALAGVRREGRWEAEEVEGRLRGVFQAREETRPPGLTGCGDAYPAGDAGACSAKPGGPLARPRMGHRHMVGARSGRRSTHDTG
jgi:hypothetical protein